MKIKITKDGPYLVEGNIPMSRMEIHVDERGTPDKWVETEKLKNADGCALCRCGKSKSKPFCDGSHAKGFNGKETANREPFDKEAELLEGPELDLKDNTILCASARFCHKSLGTWGLVESSDNPQHKKDAIESAGNCPSGRLVCVDKNGKDIEQNFKPSIVLVEDPSASCSGPIWVRGKIPIESADGKTYEFRNRVTLCRCGQSNNKPFCDGTHAQIGFKEKR